MPLNPEMRKAKTHILVVGLLSTGSSAVIDMLREYDDIHVVPNEFNDFRAPGLVADQLCNHKENGFLNDIGKLTTLKSTVKLIYGIFPILRWKINTITGIRSRFNSNSLRIKQLKALKKLNVQLVSGISAEEKIRHANQWIKEIGNINNRNKEFVLFDQPLLTAIDTKIWKEVFYPFKLIVVFRNPKDQLAEIVKKGTLYAPYGAPNVNYGGVALETIYGRNKKAAMTIHIEAIRKRFEWIDSLQYDLDKQNLLLVDFEGFINDYDKYKTVIRNFIGNQEKNQTKSKLYFDPKNAKENIGIYKNHLNKDEIETLNDLGNWYSTTIRKNQVLYNRFHQDFETV